MKTKRGKSPVGKSKAVAAKSKRKLSTAKPQQDKPKGIPVFEGTIGTEKSLYDARANSLVKLADTTGQSPKEVADKHGYVIVARSTANPDVIKTLKKAWGIAKLEEAKRLAEQEKVVADAKKATRSTKVRATQYA